LLVHVPPLGRAKTLIRGQFLRFVVVGGIVTATHFAVLIFLVELVDCPPVIATAGAFLVAVSVSYTLNGLWTFRVWNSHRQRAPRFLVVSVIGLGLNTGVFWVVLSLGALYLLAQVAASAVVMFWNFEANRRFTFVASHGT
jgi:putative flippase GtrA